jgi:hypothetical protein
VVLRLRIRMHYGGKHVEGLGIANSGFAGREPEMALPQDLIRELLGERPRTVLVERTLADGSRTLLPKLMESLDVYVVTEDRIEGPVRTYAYATRGRFILLNDALLSALRVVIIDPFEGVWCFRDELGKRERRGL